MADNGTVHMPGLRRPLLPVRPLRPVDKKRPKDEKNKKRERKERGGKRDEERDEEGIDIMA